jgi:hypothetical protein
MRYILVALCVVVAQRVDAQSLSKLDAPVEGGFVITDPSVVQPCELGALIVQVARQAGVSVGFENTPDCWFSPRLNPVKYTQPLTSASARQAFDHLMTLMPTHSWRDMDGVAVVRPRASWDDPGNVLNLPTKPFNAMNKRINDVLHDVLHHVVPVAFYPHRDVPRAGRPIDRLVSVEFPGGSMLDAVNALVRTGGELAWELGYKGGATIVVGTLDFRGGRVGAPIALPSPR